MNGGINERNSLGPRGVYVYILVTKKSLHLSPYLSKPTLCLKKKKYSVHSSTNLLFSTYCTVFVLGSLLALREVSI